MRTHPGLAPGEASRSHTRTRPALADLERAVGAAGAVPLARMNAQLSQATALVTVTWEEWARTLWLPREVREPLESAAPAP